MKQRVRSIRTAWLTCAMTAVVASSATAYAAGSTTCLTGNDPSVSNDAAQIAAVRLLIEQACVCANFDGSKGKTHGNYIQCTIAIINAQSASTPSNLRKQCKGTVKRMYQRSTCGMNPALHEVPCIRTMTTSGAVSCAILPTTKPDGTANNRCTSNKALTAVACPDLTHCLDSSDTNHDLLIAAPGDSGSCACSLASLPSGTYANSCINCDLSTQCVLSCSCAPASGDVGDCPFGCIDSSLSLPCGGDIANIDGTLTCFPD